VQRPSIHRPFCRKPSNRFRPVAAARLAFRWPPLPYPDRINCFTHLRLVPSDRVLAFQLSAREFSIADTPRPFSQTKNDVFSRHDRKILTEPHNLGNDLRLFLFDPHPSANEPIRFDAHNVEFPYFALSVAGNSNCAACLTHGDALDAPAQTTSAIPLPG